MNSIGNTKIDISYELRLCLVNDIICYFHTWEYYSKPVPASPFIGGEPAGVISKVYGIVEFPDGVKRVEPFEIKFCDEQNKILCEYNKCTKEKKHETY